MENSEIIRIYEEIIEVLLQLLEDEHEGMRAFARKKLKNYMELKYE